MIDLKLFFQIVVITCCFYSNVSAQVKSDREYWVNFAYKLSRPILENMSKGQLKQNMPIDVSTTFNRPHEIGYAEGFARLMAGISPWLSLPDDTSDEGIKRRQLREWALLSYKNAVDPQNPDYLLWGKNGQILVEAAYIAESFLRSYDTLWQPLDNTTKQRYIEKFKATRNIDPPYTNWYLFSGIIEAFLAKADHPCDLFRLNTAIRKTEEWYIGDGWFSDGPDFAFDYYTSYVFHPMYLEILHTAEQKHIYTRIDYSAYYKRELYRAQRYSIILERLISPEGTFPPVGRSITYRTAVMQPLALLALNEQLPNELPNGQVRAALTAVLHRMFDTDDNFTEKGYLKLGFYGHQPEIADFYTNTGSLYMASLILLPLGLPETHSFWQAPAEDWTQKKAWNGQSFPQDHMWKDAIPQIRDKW
ncbi:MAG: DUF2264 domain-containing protein [Alphaproteobacteria bacterium]|nr:DUF2264 domain-containing protein [Alphaproteobacteria bacterium]